MLLADRVAIITCGACVFLASKRAKYRAGAMLNVNDGMQID